LRSVWVEESGSQRAVNSFEDCVDNSLCVMRPFIPRSCPMLKGFQWSTESQRPSMDLRSKCVRTSEDEIHPSVSPDMRPPSNAENSARSATRRPQSCWAIEGVCPSVSSLYLDAWLMRVVFDAFHRQEPDSPADCVCRLLPLRNICRRDLGWPCLLDGTPWLSLLNDGQELSLHLEGVPGEFIVAGLHLLCEHSHNRWKTDYIGCST
jgi:hypothetical protein